MTNKNELLDTMEQENIIRVTLKDNAMERHTKRLLVAGHNGEVTSSYSEDAFGETEFDILNHPDMAKVLAGDMDGQDLMVNAIQIAIDLHHVEELVLSDNGNANADSLERAKTFLQETFRTLKIQTVVVDQSERAQEKVRVLNACCMDGRFGHANHTHMTEGLGEDRFDVMNFPGIALALAGDQPGGEFFESAIEKLIQKHGIEEIVLTSHQDCGAAGGSKKFESAEAERAYHMGVLERAQKNLKKRFPGLIVRTVYVQFQGNVVSYDQASVEELEEAVA